ncbi:hypothetical protein SO3561_10255 [Streptomyces olivochromogenes]|uniref:Uncharacterized protein n=1 Tax=Streptomyces olivochromogenes TaxID=1963 RepID=A0A286PGK1_STROL|nr:hypothetical protein SO3561_10255 [Streptomyces olivochromogenes]
MTATTCRDYRVVIGSRSDRRVRWFGTKVELFVLAAAVPEVDNASMAEFTGWAMDYVKSLRSGLPGARNATMILPALWPAAASSRPREAGLPTQTDGPTPVVNDDIAHTHYVWNVRTRRRGLHPSRQPVSSNSSNRGVVDPSAVRLHTNRANALRRWPVRRRRRVPLPFRPRYLVASARCAHWMCDVVLLTHWDSVSCMVRFDRCGLR